MEQRHRAGYVIGFVGLAVIGLYAHYVVPEQIAHALIVIVWALVVFLVIRLVLKTMVSMALARSNVLMAQQQVVQQRAITEGHFIDNRKAAAEVRKIEREANTIITVAKPGDQVYLTEIDSNTLTRPLHLSPGQVNGNIWFTEEDLHRWAMFNALHAPGQRRPDMLPGPALALPSGPVHLLMALDASQRVLIVGPSNSGKTTLLHHLMQRRYQQAKTVVIDPHASPQKWAGHAHRVFGVGRNYSEIEWGLQELLKLMLKRYEDIGQGLAQEESHPRINVLVDEWRAITANLGSAADVLKTLLTESRKAAFSIVIATHSERAKPLGLDGEYDLKDGFAIVRLAVINGQYTATLDTGSGEFPAILPGPFGQPAQLPASLPDDMTTLESDYHGPQPTEREQKIIKLSTAGMSDAQICYAVWGYKSSKKYPEIKAVLEKYGVSRAVETENAPNAPLHAAPDPLQEEL